MRKLIYIVTLLIFIFLTTGCEQDFTFTFPHVGNSPKANLADMECYNSFEEFAYTPKYERYGGGLPTEPWQIEATIPDEIANNYVTGGLGVHQVMFSRLYEGQQEIWLARPGRFLLDDVPSVLIYYPDSKQWRSIQGNIDGSNAYVKNVFQTNDGKIWGRNGWEWEDIPDGPILSIYNEETQQFEFASGALNYPLTKDDERVPNGFVFDSQGKIWIFVSQDGIYLYDSVTQTTSKQLDLGNIELSAIESLSDGTLYFTENLYLKRTTGESNFRAFDGMLYQFIPNDGELIELGRPDEPWPVFGGMFESSDDKVWFSAVGYRDLQDGSWHLLHSDPEEAFEHAGHQGADSPGIILESSNGLLWFTKFEDIFSGTAWYDPEINEGCMFTDFPAFVIEDDHRQLWMVVDGNLYRLALE